MRKNGTSTSACGNVNDVAGGRKTLNSVVVEEGTGGTDIVLVSLGSDDAVVFADEVESVPSLESEEDCEEEEEEEEEESDEDGGEFVVPVCPSFERVPRITFL